MSRSQRELHVVPSLSAESWKFLNQRSHGKSIYSIIPMFTKRLQDVQVLEGASAKFERGHENSWTRGHMVSIFIASSPCSQRGYRMYRSQREPVTSLSERSWEFSNQRSLGKSIYSINHYRKNPKLLERLVWANCVDPDQNAPIGAVWSGSTQFASTSTYSYMPLAVD